MNGIYAVIIGVLALLVSVLWKKATDDKASEKANEAVSEARSETAKAEFKAETAEKEKDLSQAVTPIITEAARRQAQAEAEYKSTVRDIDRAKKTNDMDLLQKIAYDLAQKALEMGAKEKN